MRLRRLLFGLVALVVLVGGVVIAARALLDEAALRRELSARLGREVGFDKVSIGLFALSVENLSIGDTAGYAPDPLVRTESLDLRYSLLALLRGKIEVHEVRIRGGSVAIEFDTAGRTNLDDLLAGRGAGEGMLVIETLSFRDVTVLLRSPSGEMTIADLAGSIGNLHAAPFALALTGTIGGKTFSVDGTGDPKAPSFRGALRADGIPLDALPLPAGVIDPKGLALAMDLRLDAGPETGTVAGKVALTNLLESECDLAGVWRAGETPTLRGTLTATTDATALRRIAALRAPLDEVRAGGRLRASVRFDGPVDRLPARVDGTFLGFSVRPEGITAPLENLQGDFTASPAEVTLKNVSCVAKGSALRLDGRIRLAPKSLDLGVTGTGVDLGALSTLADPPVLPAGIAVAGRGDVDLRLTGAPPRVVATGSIRLDGNEAALADPPLKLTALTGRVALAPGRITLEGVAGKFGASPVSASGTIEPERNRLDLAVRADALQLSELPALVGSPNLKLAGTGAFAGRVGGTIAAPAVTGDFTSDALEVFGVALREVASNLSVSPEAIEVTSLRAQTLGGSVAGTASASLVSEALPFRARVEVRELGLAETLRTLAGYAGAEGGGLSANLVLAGDGTKTATYSGNGDVTVREAAFGNLGALAHLAPFLGIRPESLRRFPNGTARFVIAGGRADLGEGLKLANSEFAVLAKGSIGLDGGLDLRCEAEAPASSFVGGLATSPIARFGGVRRTGEKVVVPFKTRGSLAAPSFAPDAMSARELLREVLAPPPAPAAPEPVPTPAPGAEAPPATSPPTTQAPQSPEDRIRERLRRVLGN